MASLGRQVGALKNALAVSLEKNKQRRLFDFFRLILVCFIMLLIKISVPRVSFPAETLTRVMLFYVSMYITGLGRNETLHTNHNEIFNDRNAVEIMTRSMTRYITRVCG